ncbi:hypothetical protein ACJX0J_007395, partial [Zea mays]
IWQQQIYICIQIMFQKVVLLGLDHIKNRDMYNAGKTHISGDSKECGEEPLLGLQPGAVLNGRKMGLRSTLLFVWQRKTLWLILSCTSLDMMEILEDLTYTERRHTGDEATWKHEEDLKFVIPFKLAIAL